MKAEVFTHLHAISAAFEQAWEAAQKLQPHLHLTRGELMTIYFRLQEARFETLSNLTEQTSLFVGTARNRTRRQKERWEAQEAERIRKRDEGEQARWAWEKQQKKKGGGS